MYKKIFANELHKIKNPIIIDIREREEYLIGHIPGSLNILGEELLDNYNRYLKENYKYVIYCQSGKRSNIICDKLSKLGYDIIEIIDGYDGFEEIKNS